MKTLIFASIPKLLCGIISWLSDSSLYLPFTLSRPSVSHTHSYLCVSRILFPYHFVGLQSRSTGPVLK